MQGARRVDGATLEKIRAQADHDVKRWHQDKRKERELRDWEEDFAKGIWEGARSLRQACREEGERRVRDAC